MYQRDVRDIIAGLSIAAAGVLIAAGAATNHALGSLRQLGGGGFPFGLGVIMAVLGVLIALPAFLRPGAPIRFEVRAPAIIIGSLALFALLVEPFGMIPAVCALIAAASLADPPVRWGAVAGSCAAMSLFCYLLFTRGLNLPLQMFDWPF